MKGRKTWAAVIGSWLAGAMPILAAIGTGEPEQIMVGVQQGMPYILAGIFGLGRGHKMEKAAEIVKENGRLIGSQPAGGPGTPSRKV